MPRGKEKEEVEQSVQQPAIPSIPVESKKKEDNVKLVPVSTEQGLAIQVPSGEQFYLGEKVSDGMVAYLSWLAQEVHDIKKNLVGR